jgi:hypothetical protein
MVYSSCCARAFVDKYQLLRVRLCLLQCQLLRVRFSLQCIVMSAIVCALFFTMSAVARALLFTLLLVAASALLFTMSAVARALFLIISVAVIFKVSFLIRNSQAAFLAKQQLQNGFENCQGKNCCVRFSKQGRGWFMNSVSMKKGLAKRFPNPSCGFDFYDLFVFH